MRALRHISVLNNDVVQLPSTLKSLQAAFRQKTSFSHIQRLHSMLYAYGATVVEIVRRKEFGELTTIPRLGSKRRTECNVSAVLLSTRKWHSRSHDKVIVC